MKITKNQIKKIVREALKENPTLSDNLASALWEAETANLDKEIEESKAKTLQAFAKKAGRKITPALKKAWQKVKPHAKDVAAYAADKAIDYGKEKLTKKIDKKFAKESRQSRKSLDRDISKITKESRASRKSPDRKISKITKESRASRKSLDRDISKISESVRTRKSPDRMISRVTLKEIKKWMKTLEENRYKKLVNADCRRVAWMVNNEGVDLKEMPVSMRKKWSKAEYGRERQLATEFLKHLESKQMNENKLRAVIREIIRKELNEKGKTSAAGKAHDYVVGPALDVVGLVPGYGNVADLANAGIYAARGKKADAALSAASAIPGAGQVATGAKWAKKAAKGVKGLSKAAKAAKTAKKAKKASHAAKAAKRTAKIVNKSK